MQKRSIGGMPHSLHCVKAFHFISSDAAWLKAGGLIACALKFYGKVVLCVVFKTAHCLPSKVFVVNEVLETFFTEYPKKEFSTLEFSILCSIYYKKKQKNIRL